MLKRLFVGLFLGLVVGGLIAAGLVKGLGMVVFPFPLVAYGAAALAGVLTGLVAGKPIWSADGKIEAALKAFFGALLAAGGMFALRQWARVELDLGAAGAGPALLGDLPAAALPIVAGLLGAFFEVDNTDVPRERTRVSVAEKAGAKVRVRGDAAAEELDEAVPPANAKRKR